MIVPVPSQLGYGLLGALVFGEAAGLPIPGETALIVAGGLAAAGHLHVPLVIVVAVLAAVSGDSLGYWLGRRRGREVLLRGGLLAEHRRRAVAKADRFFARHGLATVFIGRWIPGLRYMAAIMAGATRMPWRRFLVANVAGAVVWASAVATLACLVGAVGSLALSATGLLLGGVALLAGWIRTRRAGGASRPAPAR